MIEIYKKIAEREISKPWGIELILEQNEFYVVKILYVRSGDRLSLQYHEKKMETLFHVGGSGYVLIGTDRKRFDLFQGEKVHIEPNVIHRIGANETDDLLVLEVSTNHLDDVVRLEDDYKRGD
jgi:mannose-6-phosphate isomerase-like protein (cupin superfamily)